MGRKATKGEDAMVSRNAPSRRRYGCSRAARAVIAGLALLLLGPFSLALGGAVAAGAQTGPTDSCTLANEPGGIRTTWPPITGAQQYVYRLEIPGQPNQYNRVPNTTTLIPAPPNVTATIALSAIYADGSYSPAIQCGSITTSGTTPPDPTTTTTTTPPEPGVFNCAARPGQWKAELRWNPVAGADEYRYQVTYLEPQFPNRYGSLTGTTGEARMFAGTTGSIRLTAFTNGTAGPTASCGTVTTPQSWECSVSPVVGGVRVSTSEVFPKPSWLDFSGPSEYLAVDAAGQTLPVSRSYLSATVAAPAATEVTVSIVYAYALGGGSAPLDCGTATSLGSQIDFAATQCTEIAPVTPDVEELLKFPAEMTHYCTVGGLKIAGSAQAPFAAYQKVEQMLKAMLTTRKDVALAFESTGEFIVEMRNVGNGRARQGRGFTTPWANVLCDRSDNYSTTAHEFGHVFEWAVNLLEPGFSNRIFASYQDAMAAGKWKNVYAATNSREYFAEGVTYYFDSHFDPQLIFDADGVRTAIANRQDLASYDPQLFNLIDAAFDGLEYIDPCENQT